MYDGAAAGRALTRRDVLRAGLAGGAAATLAPFDTASIVERALAATPAGCGRLEDIEHIVIFVQENRSMDQYFGTYPGVRGFGDPKVSKLADGSGLTIFAQPGYPAPGYDGHLYPFHLDTYANGECTHDVTHDWGPQHRSWNNGAMDGWVTEHLKAEGMEHGPVAMGYYKRADLPFYHALADAFTLCDGYFCSVIGPTDPNQLYLVSGWLGQDGEKGGPVLETYGTDRPQRFGTLSWTTMPEQLQARGISWKVYSADNFSNFEDPPFSLFAQYYSNPELNQRGLQPTYPADFMADANAGTLPQISWVYTTIVQSEHPPAPITWGEVVAAEVVNALTSNTELWRKTALIITWDENGGFFDHVEPPVPPPGTPGEYVTAVTLPEAAQDIRGPIGLGFRVPTLIVSPFARGGFVCSDTFDHTSTLRLIEQRFGAEVPNLSTWRRGAVGDLVNAFNFAAPDTSVPTLPTPNMNDARVLASNCTTQPATLIPTFGSELPPYPVPPNSMPVQAQGTPRRPSGLCKDSAYELSIAISGVPRKNCVSKAMRVKVRVKHSAPLTSVKIHLNGITIHETKRESFSFSVPLRRLHKGRNRIAVIVRDADGGFKVAVRRFRRC